MNGCKIYSIEGNIGSGKSTLLRMLKKYNNNEKYLYVQEPIEIWETIKDKDGETILSKFYKNQEKYSFSFQMMAYISRLSQLNKIIKNNKNKIIICERSLNTDKNVFAKMLYDDNKIDEVEYKIYLKWFDEFCENIKVEGLIYVRSDHDIAHKRVIKRARSGEEISLNYLKLCNDYHDNWIYSESIPKLILEGNKELQENKTSYMEWIDYIVRFTC